MGCAYKIMELWFMLSCVPFLASIEANPTGFVLRRPRSVIHWLDVLVGQRGSPRIESSPSVAPIPRLVPETGTCGPLEVASLDPDRPMASP